MKSRNSRWRLLGALLCGGFLAGYGEAAIKVRTPVLLNEVPAPSAAPVSTVAGAPRPREEGRMVYIGTVIFARGDQIVAEIPEGAQERERLVVFDAGFRPRGMAVVLQSLEQGVYLLQARGPLAAASGDRLAPESEENAAIRVLRENRLESYREFMEVFPESVHRPRMAREMFRVTMQQNYPTFPGSTIEGRVRLAETVGRQLSLGQVLVKLDRFVIARTDAEGYFRIEGLPKVSEPVQLQLQVKDEKFRAAEGAPVQLPGDTLVELNAEIPLRVAPTELTGSVVDHNGAPLAGVEVWTAPYTVETLTDETGSFRISRRKRLDTGGSEAATDAPLFGGEFEVYAYRKGYSVNRSQVSAESFQQNPVAPIELVRQDPRRQPVPELGLELRAHLEIDATLASQDGAAPKLNR